MIIRYYKGNQKISSLEEMLKTNKNGTTAYHIVETLNSLGFKSYGIKRNTLNKTTIPFIANVIINSSYKHYIVVYEVNTNYVKIADPADKIKKIKKEDFYKIWTGINIEMYPIRQIANEKPKNIKLILQLLKLKKGKIIIIGLLSIVVTVLSIISTFFFQILIDNINKNINYLIVFFLTLFLFRIIVNHYRTKYLINITNNIDENLTKTIYKKIILLPYRYYHNHTTGEIISRINDMSALRNSISKVILAFFIDMPLTIFSAVLLFKINKKLFYLITIIVILYILTILLYHKKIKKQINISIQNKEEVNSIMIESISGFETIKGLNIENKIKTLFNQKYNNYIKSTLKLNNTLNRQNTLKELINIFGNAFILIIGINEVKQGSMPLSTLITYSILLSFFLEPIVNIVDLDFELKDTLNKINRVLDLIDTKQEKTKEKFKGDIIIQNLNFTLNYQNYILKNINLYIKEKNKVLITGPSGSGKSTLLKILKGYYNDYEGNIKIGKHALAPAKNIIYIGGKELMMTGTIHHNLTLKGSNKLEEKIKICHVDDILNGMELKENTLVEENGLNISNGSKQRIALARALHNFDILLIDEGLSGVDTNLERKILKKLFKKYSNKTIIIVSHRLDNLDLFNQYIKLEKGKITINASLPRKEN